MSCSYGEKVKIQIFGQSHSDMLGIVIEGLPAGIKLDLDKINVFLKRRQGGNASYTTPRKEEDLPNIVSGLADGKTCGAPLCALFENKNVKSDDYKEIADIPRPSHADFTAHIKYNGANDVRGGGHFSGRMTLPLCFAGAVCMQILEPMGITFQAHIYSVGDVADIPLNPISDKFPHYMHNALAVYDRKKGDDMVALMSKYADMGDSIGGIIECGILGLPVGLGDPMFDGIENRISSAVFGIPAIKGIEFGSGFSSSNMSGSQHNDPFTVDENKIKTVTNNSGGILGGISNGMPIIFRAAIKPTPSIGLEQASVSLKGNCIATLAVRGRHDPCIVPRAVPCVEAAAAISVINLPGVF